MTRNARYFAATLAVASCLPFSALAAPCTWTGLIDAKWSTPGNWGLCVAGPATGDDLIFPDGTANKSMNNDIANLSIGALTFNGSLGGYSLTGAGNLTITGAIAIKTDALDPNSNTLALTNPIKFGAPIATLDSTTATNNGGTLNLDGPLDLNSSTLSFVWDSSVPRNIVNGIVSGAGAIQLDATGADLGLELRASNTFTGPVTINGGYLGIFHANALGAGGADADGTTVFGNGTLVMHASVVNEHLTLQGGGGQSGNGIMQASAQRTWGGPVTLGNVNGATNNFNLLGSRITFAGPVSGPGGFTCCNGTTGSIALANAGNTYSGPTNFNNSGGILLVDVNNGLSPNSAITLGGSSGATLDMQAFSGAAAALTGSANSTLKITAGQTLTVSGAVNLANTALVLAVPGNPPIGTVFKLVDKTSGGAVSGAFNGLAEGATVTVGAVGMKISYVGGNGNDVTLTVDSTGGNHLVSVLKPGSGAGTVTSDFGAINCGVTCSDTYASATSITLTASPAAGSVFTGWLGPCIGTGTCTFAVNATTAVIATFAPDSIGNKTLDVDANDEYDALTDGLMTLRYLFGLTGAQLNANALGTGATRTLSSDIATYLTDVKPKLDIDGNGQADALTDGLLVIRYLFGLTGSSLIVNAVGPNAVRDTAPAIEAQLLTLMP